MTGRLEARAEAIARGRIAAVLSDIAADLPPGIGAERDGDSVILSGRGLARRLAFDPRLATIGRGT